MAKPNDVDGGQLLGLNGTEILNVYRPGATSSGFQDYWISGVNFLKTITTQIAAIVADIASLTSAIGLINDSNIKIRNASQSTSFTFQQDANSDISDFYMFWVSGTPTISIGTSSESDDICDSTTLSTSNRSATHRISTYTPTNRTVYVTISGGVVTLVRYIKQNINA